MAWYLAMEGGGTKSVAGLYEDGRLVAEATAGPSNPLAYGTTATAGIIADLAAQLVPRELSGYTLLAGIAGVMSDAIAGDIAAQLTALCGLDRVAITTDLHPLLFAHAPDTPGILVIAGTGASVLVHDGLGVFRRLGGRGPVMGDEGSGYQIAVAALRAVARAEDGVGPPTELQGSLHAALGLPDAEALVPWSLGATKQALAALARTVESVAEGGDPVARACMHDQAVRLAELALAACSGLPKGEPLRLWIQGGVVENAPLFRAKFFDTLRRDERVQVVPLRVRGHEAVLALRYLSGDEAWCYGRALAGEALPSTERTSPDVPPIDQLSPESFVDCMIRHESHVGRALRQQAIPLVGLTEAAAKAIGAGGRIIYVGAGTSGRLGVLDASECPPTFGTDPGQVVGLIAGGEAALRTGVEGAEDDREQGAADLAALDPAAPDIVIGIAASGTTPYVRAALDCAGARGCVTALLCCNPQVDGTGIGHVVALPTGPEALPGSTRLNAGTATKIALNIISTGALAQSGYVYAGRMVKMRASNSKLRARAIRMVAALTGTEESRSEVLLQQADFEIPVAVIMAELSVDAPEARLRLEKAQGQLHRVVKESTPK